MFKNVFVVLLAVSGVFGSPLSLSDVLTVNALSGYGPYKNYTAGVCALNGIFPAVAAVTAPLSITKLAILNGTLSAADKINLNTITNDLANQLGLPLTKKPALLAFLEYIIGLIDYGITVNFLNGQLTLGGVSLPSYLTCQTFGTSLAACQICNYDCVYVHNTYGGKCAIDNSKPLTATSGAKGYDCVCQTEPNANGTITPVQDVCGSILGSNFDTVTSLAILQFLWVRQQAELCIPQGNNQFNEAGCNVDCPRNHQYQSGSCQVVNTVPFNPSQSTTTDNGSAPYCLCSFDPSGQPTAPVSGDNSLNAPARRK